MSGGTYSYHPTFEPSSVARTLQAYARVGRIRTHIDVVGGIHRRRKRAGLAVARGVRTAVVARRGRRTAGFHVHVRLAGTARDGERDGVAGRDRHRVGRRDAPRGNRRQSNGGAAAQHGATAATTTAG